MSSEKRSKQSVVRWTADEDVSLIKLVHEHDKQWTLIASKLEGGRRNDRQCFNRWKTIDPSITKGSFSATEDAILTTLVHEHGKQWTLIASKLEGGRRSDQQCKKRWKTIDPLLTTGTFNAAENGSLTKLVHEHGTSSWPLIASKLEGGRRSDQQCRSRWRTIDPSQTKGTFNAVENATLIRLVEEHGASACTLIASKLGEGRRSDQQCSSRWRALGKFNGKGSSNSSSSSSSSKQSASPNPPSKLEAYFDNDDNDTSADDDANLDHVLIDGFSQALAAAAPHLSRKRKSTD
jgi:hypothetical protein